MNLEAIDGPYALSARVAVDNGPWLAIGLGSTDLLKNDTGPWMLLSAKGRVTALAQDEDGERITVGSAEVAGPQTLRMVYDPKSRVVTYFVGDQKLGEHPYAQAPDLTRAGMMAKGGTSAQVDDFALVAGGGLADASGSQDDDEFVIGMMDVNTDAESFRHVADMGITHVQKYAFGASTAEKDVAEDLAWLYLAEAYGLKAVPYMYVRKWAQPDTENGLEQFKQLIRRYKEIDAVDMWWLIDEPPRYDLTVEDLRPFYNFVKMETPDKPVLMSTMWKQGWWKFMDITDVFLNFYYRVREKPFPEEPLVTTARLHAKAVGTGTPHMPILQSFSYASMREDPEKYRHPNLTEMRYYHFSTLPQGIEGVWYYSHKRGMQVSPDEWFNATFRKSVEELVSFVEAVENPSEPRTLHDRTDNQTPYFSGTEAPARYAAVWSERGGGEARYLVLTNNAPEAQRIELEFDLPEDARIKPWGLTRDVQPDYEQGKLALDARPWESFVFVIRPPQAPAKAKTPSNASTNPE